MKDQHTIPQQSTALRNWKGPTIAEIARISGVGTATVDRVLNGRGSVREVTRKKVMSAVESIGAGATPETSVPSRTIKFLTDSGVSYNRSLEIAVGDYCATRTGITCPFTAIQTSQVDPVKFAQIFEREAEGADGIVVVARESLAINRAMRAITSRGTLALCLTTDLPNSGRTAYVGNDQVSAGATAAYLMGQALGERRGNILLVYSAPYRGQEDRELGFRRVLRSEFQHLDIDDRLNSNDESEYSYNNVLKYIEEHGAPVGIYNTAAGNFGIGRALRESDLAGKVVFIGHELNTNSRTLLESGVMNYAIGHDVDREVAQAIEHISALLEKRPPPPVAATRVRIFTKYNCL